MSKKKPSKLRIDLRKNRSPRVRKPDLTRDYVQGETDDDRRLSSERVSGKGDLTRRRTIVGSAGTGEGAEGGVHLEIDESLCLRGRVVSVYGLTNLVETDDGRRFQCATRRLLKTLLTDQRHVVAAGDHVLFRLSPNQPSDPSLAGEGIIERVEPRYGVISRTSRGRQHILVANVDQVLIVTSAAEPDIKPHLIDRFLVMAEKTGIAPIICINKTDLVPPGKLQPLVGVYSQLGYRVLLLSAKLGRNVERLRRAMRDRQSVVVGQSGVGKSSLLNAIDPDLQLSVSEVSEETQKGRHTTTTARLVRLPSGGYVVDTPGIRQFQLWDVTPEEVAGYFRDLRPYVSRCRFPDCTHTHEEDCAVKDAVADDLLDARRYESYCHFWDEVGP